MVQFPRELLTPGKYVLLLWNYIKPDVTLCPSMAIAIRIVCYLPLALAALDEPTNAITISVFSWVASAEPTRYFSHSQRPARGIDDVTDLARSLPPPAPSMQEGITEVLLRTPPVTFDARPLSHDPESIPLLC